jgi:hypothetical protein
MRTVSVTARIDSGRPCLEVRNEGPEPIVVTMVKLQRGNAGAGPFLQFNPKLSIKAGESWQSSDNRGRFISNPPGDAVSRWLEHGLRLILGPSEEAVIGILIDLEPPQGEEDQIGPSFFVVRLRNGQFTECFPLMGSLQGESSLLEALLESRRHGA